MAPFKLQVLQAYPTFFSIGFFLGILLALSLFGEIVQQSISLAVATLLEVANLGELSRIQIVSVVVDGGLHIEGAVEFTFAKNNFAREVK